MQLLPVEILDWVNPKINNQDNYSINSSISSFLEFGEKFFSWSK